MSNSAGIWVIHTATVRDGGKGSVSPISQNKLTPDRFRNPSKVTHRVGTEGFEPLRLKTTGEYYSSVQFSHSVMSDSLRPHGLQHSRPPCPSQTPRIYSNSCPSSRWCHPTISSSLSPSPATFNLSQHHGLFQWVSSSHQVQFQLQHLPFQWIFRTNFL